MHIPPIVALDLRGNGGGDSAYTAEIARLLAGEERAAAIDGEAAACSVPA